MRSVLYGEGAEGEMIVRKGTWNESATTITLTRQEGEDNAGRTEILLWWSARVRPQGCESDEGYE